MHLIYRESSCTWMEAISRRKPRHRHGGMSSEIDIVDLKGAGFARGELYGKMRRPQIERFLIDWLRSLGAAGLGNPQGYLSQMLEATGFSNAIDEHWPELLEEVRGI